MGQREAINRGAVLLFLSTAGMMAMPYLAERISSWGGSPRDRDGVVIATCGVACALGIWQLQVGLGMPRRTWGGRVLGLLGAVLCFIVPAWIGLCVIWKPFDPEVALRPRELPGYRISLPDWPILDRSDDYWSGHLTLTHGSSPIIVRWNPGDFSAEHGALLDGFLGKLAGGRIGSESPMVAGRPARTVYVRQDGDVVAYTALSCGDGRMFILGSGGDHEATSRRFHHRLLASVSCVAGAKAPELAFPRLKLPEGFRLSERHPSYVVYARGGDELLFWAEQRDLKALAKFDSSEARAVVVDGVAQSLNARVDGEAQSAERDAPGGRRRFWTYRLQSATGTTWLTWTFWRCGEERWFHAMATGARDSDIDRLLGASCP